MVRIAPLPRMVPIRYRPRPRYKADNTIFYRRPIITIFTWILTAFGGFLLYYKYDLLMSTTLETVIQLKPGSPITFVWQDPKVSVKACLYIFGIKNGDEFEKGEKPRLAEYGPFCYSAERIRNITGWTEDSVIYTERFKMKLLPDDSAPLDTRINVINFSIYIGVAVTKHFLDTHYMSFAGPIVYNVISYSLSATGEKLVDEIDADHILHGRKVIILEYLNLLLLKPIKMMGVNVPLAGSSRMQNHSYGYISSYSSMVYGPYYAYTKGNGKYHSVGQVYRFGNHTAFPKFGKECNQLSAGDGIFFYPRPINSSKLYIFNRHLCRRLAFVKQTDRSFMGMKVSRYIMDPNMFNAQKQSCYCRERSLTDCDGWADSEPCLEDLPLGFSFPHFMYSRIRQRDVLGMEPDLSRHSSFIDIEPILGVPVNSRLALQNVLDLYPIWSVSMLATLPIIKLPICWVRIQGQAQGKNAAFLIVCTYLIRYGKPFLLIGNCVMLVIILYLIIFK